MKAREWMRIDLGSLFRGKVEIMPKLPKESKPRRNLREVVRLTLTILFLPIVAVWRFTFPRRRLQLMTVTDQIRRIIECNAPLTPALQAVAVDAPNRRVYGVLCGLDYHIERGLKLSEGMDRMRSFFPKYYIDMIRAGENTGTLPDVLGELNHMLAESQRVWTAVRRSLVYLFFLLGISLTLSTFLAIKVFPVFAQIIKDFGGSIHGPNGAGFVLAAMDGIGNTFQKAPLLLNIIRLILAVLVVIAAIKLRRRLWNAIQYLALCIPFFRQIVIKSNVATISQVLGRLLKAGYPMDAALSTAAEGDMLPVFNRMLRRIRARVLQGEDFAAAAAREWLLPSSYIGMLSIGEGAGDLPHSLEYVSDYYQREAIKNCVITTRIAFPIIVVLVGCWVLLVYTYPFQAIITIVDTMTTGM